MDEMPSTSTQDNKAAAFSALQENIAVLRQKIVNAEETLDQVLPEDIPQFKTALLKVSKMISQIEGVADGMNVHRLNLKNEIRTFHDENIHIQGALIRERRKAQGKDRITSLRGGRHIPPPPPPLPKRDNSAVYNSMRSFIFPPTAPRNRNFNENEASVIDLTFDGTGSSTSATGVPPNGSGNPGTSRGRRLRCGSARTGRVGALAGLLSAGRRSTSVRTGNATATRGRLRPSLRVLSGNDVTGSAPTAGGWAPTAPIGPVDLRPSVGSNETNENCNRNNRNNRFAGKRNVFHILNSYPSLD